MSTIKRKAKVVMLPIEKTIEAENLVLLKAKNCGYPNAKNILKLVQHKTLYPLYDAQYLYIISPDEEIKEGDCFLINYGKGINGGGKIGQHYKGQKLDKTDIKIIATTDTSLGNQFKVNHGASITTSFNPLPQPSPQFIQKFIEGYNKNNIISDIMVEYEEEEFNNSTGKWNTLRIDKNNYITITRCKDSWNREEVKSLILKFAENCDSNEDLICYDGYINGIRQYNAAKKWIEENL